VPAVAFSKAASAGCARETGSVSTDAVWPFPRGPVPPLISPSARSRAINVAISGVRVPATETETVSAMTCSTRSASSGGTSATSISARIRTIVSKLRTGSSYRSILSCRVSPSAMTAAALIAAATMR
jgi:hypothetical protein